MIFIGLSLSLMLTMALLCYQEAFPSATLTVCQLKDYHLTSKSPFLAAARPVMQAFWQSEIAPICYKEEHTFNAL